MPVFSLGGEDPCNTDLILAGSLFDLTPPPEALPPVAEVLLASRPEFAAVWFTYEYYDLGPLHSVEVLSLTVCVCITLSSV